MLSKKTILSSSLILMVLLIGLLIATYYINPGETSIVSPSCSNEHISSDETQMVSSSNSDNSVCGKKILNGDSMDWTLLDDHDSIGQKWDNFSIDLDITDCTKSEITELIQGWKVKGDPIDEQKVKQLKDTLTELVYAYGREDLDGWIDYLEASGENLRADIEEKTRNGLVKTYNVKESELAEDGWELLKQSAEVKNKRSNWRGLSLEGASIQIIRTTGEDLPETGKDIQVFRSYKYTLPHIAESPVTPVEIFNNDKELVFSDITFFILHSNESGGRIQPYVMRSWYDSGNDIWRPLALSYFPDRKEYVEVSQMPVF